MATESRRASGHNRIPDAKTPYVYYDPEKDKVLGIGKPCECQPSLCYDIH